jgi:putative ABC transport system substrate-binding protein
VLANLRRGAVIHLMIQSLIHSLVDPSGDRMRRREFIILLSGAARWPLGVRAQQSAIPVVGFLCSGSAEACAELVPSFGAGLKESGYVEGQNAAIEYRWADGHYDRLPKLAADLVSRQVAVIAAIGGAVAALAAKHATSTVPIVFASGDDPVKYGLVANLSHPGGNLTGATLFIDILTAKRLELLTEVAPAAELAMVINPRNPNAETEGSDARAAAKKSGRELRILNANNESEIDAAVANIARQPGAALTIGTDTFFFSRKNQLVGLAARYAIPTIYFHRGFGLAGGLITYGSTFTDEWRMVGQYAGRILGGAKPVDLPVQQPTKFELVINLKTARALGITIPPSILVRADEVIE